MADKKSFEKQALSLSEDELEGVGGGVDGSLQLGRCHKCNALTLRFTKVCEWEGRIAKYKNVPECEECGMKKQQVSWNEKRNEKRNFF
jgi:NAD-dependent SIR2 family protein deacetylase